MLYVSGGAISDLPGLSELRKLIKINASGSVGSPKLSSNPKVTVYKWQDQDGVWHYSEQKPAFKAQELRINSNANLIQSFDIPDSEADGQPSKAYFGRIGQDAPKKEEQDEVNTLDELRHTLNNIQNRNAILDDF